MTKILVAEDERDIRELVGHTLRFAGYEIVLVTNGVEAVEAVSREKPDLILLDVRMPKMSGYEACRLIKESPATSEIPVVFLSAKGRESEVEQGIESGALEYILKPFAPADLIAQIESILEASGQ